MRLSKLWLWGRTFVLCLLAVGCATDLIDTDEFSDLDPSRLTVAEPVESSPTESASPGDVPDEADFGLDDELMAGIYGSFKNFEVVANADVVEVSSPDDQIGFRPLSQSAVSAIRSVFGQSQNFERGPHRPRSFPPDSTYRFIRAERQVEVRVHIATRYLEVFVEGERVGGGRLVPLQKLRWVLEAVEVWYPPRRVFTCPVGEPEHIGLDYDQLGLQQLEREIGINTDTAPVAGTTRLAE